MGLFRSPRPSDTAPDTTRDTAVPRDPGAPAEESAEPAVEGGPAVGVSVSTFRGVGVGGADPSPAADRSQIPDADRAENVHEAPGAHESVPGVRDNELLRGALATLPEDPAPEQILDVARQLLQGHVFLRVKGDARSLLAEGKDLPLLVAAQGDQQYVMVFSGGAALQASLRADGDTDTSAMAQPVPVVLQHVLAGPYAGIVLDHSSAPARLVLPRDLLEKAQKDAGPQLRVKTLLAAPRTDATASEIVEALPNAPLWIAANRGENGQIGIAEARTADGARFVELFSHPLEVFALGRRDQPVQVTLAQLAAALSGDEEITGVILDPAGPWIRLTRSDLAPALAR